MHIILLSHTGPVPWPNFARFACRMNICVKLLQTTPNELGINLLQLNLAWKCTYDKRPLIFQKEPIIFHCLGGTEDFCSVAVKFTRSLPILIIPPHWTLVFLSPPFNLRYRWLFYYRSPPENHVIPHILRSPPPWPPRRRWIVNGNDHWKKILPDKLL